MIAAGLYFVEHFELLKRLFTDMNKNVRFCAAELINVFKRWRDWKVTHHRTEWVYYKQKMLKEELRDRYSMHVIRSAIEYLLESEILERRNNPSNGQDKTFQYRLNTGKLDELMDVACELETEKPMFEIENSEFTVENQTQDLTTESITEILPTSEEEKKEEPDRNEQSEDKSPRPSGQMGKEIDIPDDLATKLEELEIPLDKKVRKAIASHHISQAWGAVNHVQNTWETIDNLRSVFLYQIGKQPIERMGSASEYRASDIDLDYLKFIYPNSWKEAAAHFGIEEFNC
jgi:hypothetical protein